MPVMAGFSPAIHVDPRDTPGDDGAGGERSAATAADAIPLGLRRTGTTPRQVLAMTLIGTLVLAVFTSRDLAAWLDRMGNGPFLEPLQRAAAQWGTAMDRLGFAMPAELLRDGMQRVLDWRCDTAP